jgi:hypothetical protein
VTALGPDGCLPGPLFEDLDHDGYGGRPVQAFGCSSDGLVTTAGDCFDAEPTAQNLAQQVHPGQTLYFYVGFVDTSRPGDISFDFDCSGSEERQPGYATAAPDCEALDDNECAGSGYYPSFERSGVAGVDGLCGSELVVTCRRSGPTCSSSFDPTDLVYPCR